MTLRTPAAFSVSMFCCAWFWNRYSLPSRRAGSPVQDSAGPSTAKLTPAGASRRAIDWVVLRARSSSAPAQPTQNRYSTSSGIVPSTTGTSKSRPSVHSRRFAGPSPHGSPRFSTLRSIEPASDGKRGLHQHLVAAHVDDRVDVLDVDGALLDARPAGRAGPEHVRLDHAGDQRLRRRRVRVGVGRAREQPGRGGEQLVAQVHHDELGREGLAGVPGRALALAAPALGAGDEVEQLLPGEVVDPAGAEDRVLVHRLDVDLGVLSRAPSARGLAGEGDVQRCHEDVKVLGVHDEAPGTT